MFIRDGCQVFSDMLKGHFDTEVSLQLQGVKPKKSEKGGKDWAASVSFITRIQNW